MISVNKRAATAVGVAAMLLVVVGGGFAYVQHQTKRTQEALAAADYAVASADPCAVAKLSVDMIIAAAPERPELIEQVRAGGVLCKEKERCEPYAKLLEAGPQASALVSDASSQLVVRVAHGALDPGDLALTKTSMPCAGASTGEHIWEALVRAAASASPAWTSAGPVSADLAAAVTNVGMSGDAKASLRARAEATAIQSAKSATTSTALAGPKTLCAVEVLLTGGKGAGCKMLVGVEAKLEKQERAAQLAADAKEKEGAAAEEARSERERKAEVDREGEAAFDYVSGCMRRCREQGAGDPKWCAQFCVTGRATDE
jgi:hypothetical protein